MFACGCACALGSRWVVWVVWLVYGAGRRWLQVWTASWSGAVNMCVGMGSDGLRRGGQHGRRQQRVRVFVCVLGWSLGAELYRSL